jgi:EpsI family protein
LAACAWALLLAGLAVVFAGAFKTMWRYHWFPAWNSPDLGLYERLVKGDSYYTHGPLVPLVSLVTIALLVRYTRIPVRPSPVGGSLVVILGLLLHLLGAFAEFVFIQGFAFVVVIVGLVLLLWGGVAVRRLWVPIALLLFMVPLPPSVIHEASFRLKMIAADWGVRVAGVLGIMVERSGSNLIFQGNRSMMVGDVCSGLRSLLSLLGFGALYVYVCRLRRGWRLWLFAMTVPVAIVSNCVRIVSLIIVADIWGVEVASGWYHDSSGVLTFLCALGLMYGLEALVIVVHRWYGRPVKVGRLLGDVRRGQEDRGQLRALFAAPASRWGILAAGVLWLGVAVAGSLAGPASPADQTELARAALPMVLEAGGKRFQGEELPMDNRTQTILRTSDYAFRNYVCEGEAPVTVCVTYSRSNRRSTHPPDICLEGGGRTIAARGRIEIDGVSGRGALPCREIVLQDRDGLEYFLYTYKVGSSYTSNWYSQQASILVRSLLGGGNSGALIRLSTPVLGKDVVEARQRLTEMMRVVVPCCDQGLP